jgi:uncharacterized membrane protein YphA (DoxX/SURF4 family)
MFVAAWTVHRANGFVIVKEGWEYNLILAVSAVAVAAIGPASSAWTTRCSARRDSTTTCMDGGDC